MALALQVYVVNSDEYEFSNWHIIDLRWFIPIFLLLLSGNATIFLSHLESTDSPRYPTADVPDDWRRTADGWQRVSSWDLPGSDRGIAKFAAVHPSLVGAFQLLVAMFGLLAFSPSVSRSRQSQSSTLQA